MSSGRSAGKRPAPGFPAVALAAHVVLPLLMVMGVMAWPVALLTLFAFHLAVVYGSLWPRSRLLGPNMLRVGAERHGGSRVYLTFDDGPDGMVTPQVLDILQQAGARASFFVVGDKVARFPDLARRTAAAGHTLENHTLGHLHRFSLLTPWQMGREIDGAQKIIADVAGRSPVYFRAPAGLRSPWLLPLLDRRGLRLVTWTRRGFDAASRDPERVLARLTRKLQAGDILVLHDGSAARTGNGEPVVCQVLPLLLEEIRRRGLQPAPLPSLPDAGS